MSTELDSTFLRALIRSNDNLHNKIADSTIMQNELNEYVYFTFLAHELMTRLIKF